MFWKVIAVRYREGEGKREISIWTNNQMNDEFLFQASNSTERRVLPTALDSSPFTSHSKGLSGLIYNACAGRWDKQVRGTSAWKVFRNGRAIWKSVRAERDCQVLGAHSMATGAIMSMLRCSRGS